VRGEELDQAAVVEALDLKDRASRDDLAGFLLTPPPRVVTARLPVRVSALLHLVLIQGVADLDLRRWHGRQTQQPQ
jgi:hypothetical protein